MASAGTVYKFKGITKVPTASALVDVVLSKTQRKTPTQVHPQFKISRIRSFYMRKIKFCQQTFRDKCSNIIEEFPRLDAIHPFYSDLCNVLYDRDHYKLALGQVNTSRSIVDSIGKDYVRLLKYSDSQYKCKMLKRAGMGRMVTAIKRLKDSLLYLEEVRQHLSRLPTINPSTRTLILAGYPNVGKSSFMNLVSQANVDVQPYAFTTKSLFVGHFDYDYTRWQVVDTPGILDHPLADRNTIEMTAITALAHLPAAVLFFVDLSEQCGFSLEAQVALFHSIKPLFKNKPLIIVLNKTDVRPLEDLNPTETELIESMRDGREGNVPDDGGEVSTKASTAIEFVTTSCVTKTGVDEAKNKACTALISQRLLTKGDGEDVALGADHNAPLSEQRFTVTSVALNPDRPPYIPDAVVQAKREAVKSREGTTSGGDVSMGRELSAATGSVGVGGRGGYKGWSKDMELEEEYGGAGVYVADLQKNYLLRDDSWKYDTVPEIMEGKNIGDFVDVDIEAKLQMLLLEEQRLQTNDNRPELTEVESTWQATQTLLTKLNNRIKLQQVEHGMKLPKNSRALPRRPQAERSSVSAMVTKLDELGYNTDLIKTRARDLPLGSTLNPILALNPSSPMLDKDGSPLSSASTDATATDDTTLATTSTKHSSLVAKLRRANPHRLVQLDSGKKLLMPVRKGFKPSRVDLSAPTVEQKWKNELWRRKSERPRNKQGRAGEGDRFIGTKMPRHLYSGKRGIGKTQWR